MNYEQVARIVQTHFSDGLVIVIGSGLSLAEGVPGMADLADGLVNASDNFSEQDQANREEIRSELVNGLGLESALSRHQPTASVEQWIKNKICDILMPAELEIISAIALGRKVLRLSDFLAKILIPSSGLPIITTNYDRLAEVACEIAGLHVDTTAIGLYAGVFDEQRSCMSSCKKVILRKRQPVLDHFPRAIVLKPHGSFDWFQFGGEARRSSLNLSANRLIVSPGTNKYRAGYESPFDKHREIANRQINSCSRLLIVGFGFNDDHLQIHLERKIRDGTPTIILTRTLGGKVKELAEESPNCYCLSRYPTSGISGFSLTTHRSGLVHEGPDLWDLRVLTDTILS
jgi:hypothetical protein